MVHRIVLCNRKHVRAGPLIWFAFLCHIKNKNPGIWADTGENPVTWVERAAETTKFASRADEYKSTVHGALFAKYPHCCRP